MSLRISTQSKKNKRQIMRSWGTLAFKRKTGSDTLTHTHTKLKTQKGMKRTETVTLHKRRKTKQSNINSNR